MDLSKLSDEDLKALYSGGIQSMSDDGLRVLSGQEPEKVTDKSFEDVPDSERHQFQIKDDREHDVPELQPRPAKTWDERMINDATRHYIGISELITDPLLLGAHVSDKIFGTDSAPAIQSKIDWLNKVKERAKASNRVDGIDFIGQGSKAGASILGLGKLKIAQTLFGKTSQGGLLGAYFGGTTYKPEEGEEFSLSDAGKEAAIGAGVGAVAAPVVDTAVKVGRGAASVYKHLSKGGNPGSIATKAAGDRVSKVIHRLETEKSKTPGVKLTAGQAAVDAGSPQFSALEKHVTKRVPESLGTTGTKGAQEKARSKVISEISGTPDDMAKAKALRSKESGKLYKKAYGESVKVDKDLVAMSKNPYFKDATKDAIKLAKAEGFGFKDNPTKFLHFVKVSIDKQLAKTGDTALGTAEKVAAQDLKKKLVNWIGNKNKTYELARAKHAELSQPINQMEVGQVLRKALESPLESERAASFANTVRKLETDVNKHTGKPLISALTKEQKDSVYSILSDLKRNVKLNEQAKEGTHSMLERVGAAELPPTGFFKPIVSAARGWFNKLTGKMTEKGMKELAILMKHPEKLAKEMKKYSPEQQKNMSVVLQKFLVRPAVVTGTQVKEDK